MGCGVSALPGQGAKSFPVAAGDGDCRASLGDVFLVVLLIQARDQAVCLILSRNREGPAIMTGKENRRAGRPPSVNHRIAEGREGVLRLQSHTASCAKGQDGGVQEPD